MTPNFMAERSLDRSCQLLNQQSRLIGPNFQAGKKIASVIFGRGEVNDYEFFLAVDKAALNQTWMDFCPLGVKVGISSHKSTQIHIN